MAEKVYNWTDDPMVSGVADCNTDVVNDCLMHLKYDNKSDSGLEVCDIGMALYIDETKGLRRYLNGQVVDINTNTQAFLNRLKEITTLYPSLLCTEEEWQSAKTMSAFGQVGKFVFNYNGADIVSVRIPRVVNVQGLFDLQNLGMTVDESLPNITGDTGIFNGLANAGRTGSGAIQVTQVANDTWGGYGTGAQTTIAINASKSSSTYQDNAPVQQEAIQYPYFIQIATGSETENNIVNEIELNNPYSLFDSKYSDHELFNLSWLVSNGSYNGSNAVHPSAYQALLVENNAEVTIGSTVTLPNGIKYTKQGLSVKLSTEEYTDYDFVLNTAEETFRLPLKNHTADDSIEGLTLYFYVGETVQNAKLIDAGRIGEQLATKTDMLQASGAGMPSSRYIDLTLGASGTEYTAPANGYIGLATFNPNTTGSYQAYIAIYAENGVDILGRINVCTINYYTGGCMQPIKKGQKFIYYYESNVQTHLFRFIYAEGSK